MSSGQEWRMTALPFCFFHGIFAAARPVCGAGFHGRFSHAMTFITHPLVQKRCVRYE